MAENTESGKKTLTMNRSSKLSLTKTVDGGKVQQNFTHGRSKSVMVEVRKTRTFTRKGEGSPEAEVIDVSAKLEALKSTPVDQVRDKNKLKQATSELNVSTPAARKDVTTRTKKEVTPAVEAPVAETPAVEAPAAAPVEKTAPAAAPAAPAAPATSVRKETFTMPSTIKRSGKMRNLDTPRAAQSDAKRDVVTAPRKEAPEPVKPAAAPAAAARPAAASAAAEAGSSESAGPAAVAKKRVYEDGSTEEKKQKKIRLKSGGNSRRQSNKLTISQALENQDERMRSLASLKRRREKMKRLEGGFTETKEKIIHEVIVPENITVQELANRMAERATDVVKALMKLGTMATPSQAIDADTAEVIIGEFGHVIKRVSESDVENILIEEPDDEKDLESRPPVVTIMGHVDHGKTSLLDALRKTDVVGGEAGGITQHIGAYQIRAGSGNGKVTFLDTPGHEAFTAMRSRGARATDIIVLVVAGDDGIKAQTEEAIAHAKSAEVPIIVAINKMDKAGSDAARVKNELMQHSLIAEEFGGDIQVIEVSAKTRAGLDELTEALVLQAEILELKANPNRKAAGVVIEAEVDKGRGAVATLLLQKGSLRVGDLVVAGSAWGRVRAMNNDQAQKIQKAVPAQPVVVIGFGDAPMAGEEFSVVDDEKTARDITEYRMRRDKEHRNLVSAKTLDQLFAEAQAGEHKELVMVIKGDVQGSVEAIIGSVSKFNNEEVSVKVLHSGAGGINESDISLAQATGAIVVGFNVRATVGARDLAKEEGVDIRYYSVIYDLVDDVKAALSGLLAPTLRENLLGYAKIREVFHVSKIGKVAGCMVSEGLIKRGAKVRLLRENIVIHEGTLKTLKRFKDEVKEVKSGYECGMAFENYEDIRPEDQIEAFEIEEIARSVE